MSDQVKELHSRAMDIAETAFAAKRKGLYEEAKRLSSEAFEYESKAALLLLDQFEIEPTRSVLFRSSACLALDAEKYEQAKKMIDYGLQGNPSYDIKEELEALLQEMRESKAVEEKVLEYKSDILNIHFNDGKSVSLGAIKLDFFAPLINSYNELRKAVFCTSYGSELEIIASASGSFNVFLKPVKESQDDMFKEQSLERRLGDIINFSNSVKSLKKLKLNEKELSKLKSFLNCISRNEASINFHFFSLEKERINYSVDINKAISILASIDKLDYDNQYESSCKGKFVALDLTAKTFKFLIDGENKPTNGRICDSVYGKMEEVSFANVYKINILKHETKNVGEQEIKVKKILTYIENI